MKGLLNCRFRGTQWPALRSSAPPGHYRSDRTPETVLSGNPRIARRAPALRSKLAAVASRSAERARGVPPGVTGSRPGFRVANAADRMRTCLAAYASCVRVDPGHAHGRM